MRCPQGRTKQCFFQKHDTGGFPEQLRSRSVVEKDGDRQDYFYVEDLAGLVAGTMPEAPFCHRGAVDLRINLVMIGNRLQS
ncbi:non-homologous end-joining DNA ligase LigD [Devosia indica]